jgi:nicotinic acid mononucleotide adenylyltransferase
MSNIVLAFGRCNPPTGGHYVMIEQLEQVARELGIQAEMFIVDGESTGQDKQKNPLTPEQRVKILREWFPNVRFDICSSAYDVMEILEVQNKKPQVLIAGSDRAKKYRRLLDYAGFINAAIREIDRDSGNANGISATKVRQAIRDGNYELFLEMMPSNVGNQSKKDLYDLVRKAIVEDGNGQDKL